MKQQIFLSLVLLAPLFASVACSKNEKMTTAVVETAEYYTCPMHPQVHEHKGGPCPICGMPLIKVQAKAAGQTEIKKSQNSLEVSEQQQKYSNISKFKIVSQDFNWSLSASGRINSPKEVIFQVYEADLAQLKIGTEFTGLASSAPNQMMKGKITSLDRLVDPSSRTVRVTGQLSGGTSIPLMETGFQGELFSVIKNQIVIPEEAVLHAGTRDLVYVFTDENILEPRKVQLGLKAKGQYQILSGLKAGDSISTGPNFLLDSEAKIRSQ